MNRCTALFCAVVMAVSPIGVRAEKQDKNLGYARGIVAFEKKHNGIKDGSSLLSGDIAKDAGTDSSDWLAIAALRYGLEDSTGEYFKAWETYIVNSYAENDGLDEVKATEWHRAVLTSLALGFDPTDIQGIDLLADGTYERDEKHPLDEQGLNGKIWALIALDSCDWKISDDAELSRAELVNDIISAQHEDGGFSLDGTVQESDPDITAMAVQALAPYRGCMEVSEAAEKALDELASQRGSLSSCESVAQCVCALCCMGIDPEKDERFAGITEELYSYACDDGGFAHEKGGASSEVASAQTLIALCSLDRLEKGERPIYDFIPERPAPLQEGTLAEVTAAKDLNTECPIKDADPMTLEKGMSPVKMMVTGIIVAVVAAAFVAGGMFRKRKEITK